jgi:spore germination protein GerM
LLCLAGALIILGCWRAGPQAAAPSDAEQQGTPTHAAIETPGATLPTSGAAPTRALARPVPEQGDGRAIYLPRLFEDGSLGLRAVGRSATRPDDPARDAMEALVRGPTGDERADDFQFALDPRTGIRSIQVAGSTATVDFESGLERIHGRPFSELVFWSMVYTLTEAPGVERVTLLERGEPLRELGSPAFAVPASATRADAPDWVRPR